MSEAGDDDRVCRNCGVMQRPEAGPLNRRSGGVPRFEEHHTSYVPEVKVWLCQRCHKDLHDGLLPESADSLLPAVSKRRVQLLRERRDLRSRLHLIEDRMDDVDEEIRGLGLARDAPPARETDEGGV